MDFKFNPELISIDMDVKDKYELIDELSKMLFLEKIVTDEYSRLVKNREKEYPTGLMTKGSIIAIPHAFDKNIEGTSIAIGILKNPVLFKNMEDTEEDINVKIVFMLAIGSAKKQLDILKILMKIFKNADLLNYMENEKNKHKMCDALNEYIANINFN